MRTRNYNKGRVKELFENALREATPFNVATWGSQLNYKEFDELPEKRVFDDSKKIKINHYSHMNGEVIAFCVIRERYLKLIQDGELSDRKHEYNIFKKYAKIFSSENNEFALSTYELICADDCKCAECLEVDSYENKSDLSLYDNPHYNGNLDNDQQSAEFWNNI